MANLHSAWTSVRGSMMHARLSNNWHSTAPAVILIHGVLVSGRYMAPTAALLAVDYRIAVPDLPGFGRSKRLTGRVSVSSLADALVAWMAAEGLDRTFLLGNSFGCQVAVNLAVRYPELVDGLILVSPSVDPHAHSLVQQAIRLVHDSLYERLTLPFLLMRDLLEMGGPHAIAAIRAMMRDRIEISLPEVCVPALVVRGQRDPLCPQLWAEEATRLLPHGRLATIPATGHAANYSNPIALTALVRGFVTEVASNLSPGATLIPGAGCPAGLQGQA